MLLLVTGASLDILMSAGSKDAETFDPEPLPLILNLNGLDWDASRNEQS